MKEDIFFSSAGLGWNCSEIETSQRIFVLTLNKQLVLTYNFATAITETTTHKLQTLTSTLQMVSKPQNCELKQEPRTQATALYQPLKFHNRERKFFFLIYRDGLELFRNRNFAANFCFNTSACFDLQFCHCHL